MNGLENWNYNNFKIIIENEYQEFLNYPSFSKNSVYIGTKIQILTNKDNYWFYDNNFDLEYLEKCLNSDSFCLINFKNSRYSYKNIAKFIYLNRE